MQRGFSPIIVVIVVAAIALLGGGLFYAGRITAPKSDIQNSLPIPKSLRTTSDNNGQAIPEAKNQDTRIDKTADWKTYVGKPQLNFTVKYPSSWSVREDFNKAYNHYQQVFIESVPVTDSNYKDIFKFDFIGDPNTTRIKGTSFSVAVQPNSNNQTAEEFAEGVVGGCHTNNKSSKVVDGITGLMYSPDQSSSCKTKGSTIYVPKGDLMYIIMFDSAEGLYDTFPQILSTLKFN